MTDTTDAAALAPADPRPRRPAGLSAVQGTALYVGAVLGTGVITLPALAAEVAGPASLVAWLLLAVLSAPLAATFAALGARHPDSGGVATYARLAFGNRAATVVGWCFWFAIPPGSAAAGLWAGGYVAAATGTGRAVEVGVAALLILLVTCSNALGMRVTGRVQLALSVLLVGFLLVAVAASAPHADPARLTPFAPHGWLAIGPAAALLTWCFVGWEAITHLTAEFADPRRDVPRATAAAVAIVATMYLVVAAAGTLVLGDDMAHSSAPLADLLATAFGGPARGFAAAAAVLLTLGTMNTYYAGAAKLGAALGRDGSLPAALARGSRAGEVPRRSLLVGSALALIGLAVTVLSDVDVRTLVMVTSGQFVAVYAVGTAAAVRLLPRRSAGRRVALLSLAAVLVLLVMTGVHLLWAAVVSAAALLRRPGAGAR